MHTDTQVERDRSRWTWAVPVVLLVALVAWRLPTRLDDRAGTKPPAAEHVATAIPYRTYDLGTDRLRRGLLAPAQPSKFSDLEAAVGASMLRHGFKQVSHDCSGDPPCRPAVPAGQVFVDASGVYVRVCLIGRDDHITRSPEAQGRNIGCADGIAAVRTEGAEDGDVLMELTYRDFGAGRWLE